MAKQKINKNVIAGLTVGAIFALVTTVAIGAAAFAKKDPQVLAGKAAEFEKSGDLKRAGDTFIRAYTIDKEAHYLIDAARCYYSLGAVGDAIELLRKAQAAAPNDPKILIPILERYWELRMLGWDRWALIRESASALLQIEPDNLLARALLAEALFNERERDSGNLAKSEEHLKRANELDATDPRVAIVTAMHIWQLELEKIRKTPGLDQQQTNQRANEARIAAIAPLRAAFAANPKHAKLAITLSSYLQGANQPADARAVLEKAAAESPDSWELRGSLAEMMLNEQQAMADASPEERLKAIDEALKHVEQAIRLEPAAFACYPIRARLLERKFALDGSWDSQRVEKMKEIFEIFVRANNDTVQLQSLVASLSDSARATMIRNGFELAMKHFDGSTAKEAKTVALAYAAKFAEMMRLRYPTQELAPLMEGWVAANKGDTRRAIQLYKDAEKAGGDKSGATFFIKEQLALLQANDAPGAALRYVDECLDFLNRQNQTPPWRLVGLKINLLSVLDRKQDAYNFIELMEGGMKDNKSLLVAKARLMETLNIPGAEELLKRIGDSPAMLVERARLASVAQKYDEALELLTRYLPGQPSDLEAIRLYATIIVRTDRREEGVALLDKLLPLATEPNIRRTIEAYRVNLSETDPAKRESKILAILESIEDECQRADSLINFYALRGNWEKIAELLPSLEKCRGADDPTFMNLSFDLAIAKSDLDAAEQWSLRLTRANADRAGGATYRGRLAGYRGKIPDAIREYRLAERDLPSDPMIKATLAELLLRSAPPQIDEAIAVLKQGLEIDPRNFAINRFLFECYSAQGREAEAMASLVVAAEVNPADEFIQQRMKLVEEAKDPSKGIDWREQTRKDNPKDVDNLIRLATNYERLKQFTKADECLTEAMAVAPAGPRVATAIVQVYGNRKSPDGTPDPEARRIGEEFLRQHLEAVSGVAKIDAYLGLGRFYELCGDGAAAINTYQTTERGIDEWTADVPDIRPRARCFVNAAMGAYYKKNGRFAEAVEAYRAALSHVKPEERAQARDLRVELVEALFSNQQFGDAAREVDAFEKDFPTDHRAKTLRARWVLAQKSDDKAMNDAAALLTQALALKPDDAFSLLTRARIYAVLRRFNDARDDLIKLKSVNRAIYEGRRELARIYELSQNFDLAKTEWAEILTDRQTGSPEDARTAAVDLIEFLGRVKRPLEAEAEISKLIAREPDNYFWYFQLGKMMSSRKEYSAAITALNRAMDLTTGTQPAVIIAWADALTAGNRAGEAVAAKSRLKKESLTPLVRASLAGAHMKLQQKAEAIKELEEAMIGAANERVGTADAVLERAARYLGVADTTTLLRTCLKIVEGKKESEDRLKTVLARVLVAMPDKAARDEGIALADSVIGGTNPRSPVNTTARIAKASALDAAGDYDGAIAVYESVVKDAPENPAAVNNLAYLLVERKNKAAEALPYAERAVRLAPTDVNVLDTVGTVHLRNSNLSQAEAVLREAVRLAPESVAANFHLGETIARAGRPTEARQYFDRVVELTGSATGNEYRRRAEEEIAKLK